MAVQTLRGLFFLAAVTDNAGQNAMTIGRLMKVPQAAKRLGVSQPTVLNLISSGELPAMKICRTYSIFEDDLAAFMDRARSRAVKVPA